MQHQMNKVTYSEIHNGCYIVGLPFIVERISVILIENLQKTTYLLTGSGIDQWSLAAEYPKSYNIWTNERLFCLIASNNFITKFQYIFWSKRASSKCRSMTSWRTCYCSATFISYFHWGRNFDIYGWDALSKNLIMNETPIKTACYQLHFSE